jgi:peptidoglycan/LPS O-acetylase OafA/YrhL
LVDIKGVWHNIMVWFGQLSAYLFVIHPIVRPYFINDVKEGGDPYLNLAFYLFISFLLAILYRKATIALRDKRSI